MDDLIISPTGQSSISREKRDRFIRLINQNESKKDRESKFEELMKKRIEEKEENEKKD